MNFWQVFHYLTSPQFRDQLKERFDEPIDELRFDPKGWAINERVIQIPSQRSWYYRRLHTKDGLPDGITAHFTATRAGTARAMAMRRHDHPRGKFKPRPPGSWHFTVAMNGDVYQQLSLRRGGFHAGSKTARRTPVGWANFTTAGIELEGFGTEFTEEQVESACWLWRGIVQHCGIEREHAMFEHSWIDPTRKTDPGELWMTQYAPRVLNYAFTRASTR